MRAVTLLAFLPVGLCALQPRRALLAFSSKQHEPLENLRLDGVESSQSLVHALGGLSLCKYDAVVIVDQPGLDLEDLYSIPHASSLSTMVRSCPSKKLASYRPSQSLLEEAARALVELCGSTHMRMALGDGVQESRPSTEKAVISVSLPELQSQGRGRKDIMSNIVTELAKDLKTIESTFSNHFVLFAGSAGNSLSKRRFQDVDEHVASPFFRQPAPISFENRNANSTLPVGGLFKQYQFFTPGLLMALLISLGILLPILYFGISALASIQTPQRMDAPKADKKGQ